jgi:hypothetical protein
VTLNDIRRFAIKSQSRLTFPVEGGLACVVNEHGIVKIPGLAGPPAFNLDHQFAAAGSFVLEPAAVGKDKPQAVRLGRAELAAKLGAAATEADDEHDE